MFGRVGIVLVPVLLVVVWLVQRSRRSLELEPSCQGAAAAEYRHALRWRWAGLVLGVVVVALTAGAGSLGLGVMASPTIFGFCVIAGVIVGELATIPRRLGVRTAALETRTVGRYLPRRLGGLVAASTVALGVLLTTTTVMGSADDMGRAGRSLSRECSRGWGASSGPWPGVFYSVPLGIAVAVGLLGAAVALRAVVLRPRSGSTPELLSADDVRRQHSAEAVVAATGVMVAASLLGIALTAAGALLGFACPPISWTILGVALLIVGVLMFLLVIWCLALLLGGPRLHAQSAGDRVVAGQGARR